MLQPDWGSHVLCATQINRRVFQTRFQSTKKEMSMKPLIGYDWQEGRSKQVAYISQDHHIHEFSFSMEGSWQHADWTQLPGPPLASSSFIHGNSRPEGGL